jgi:hypothetical protein
MTPSQQAIEPRSTGSGFSYAATFNALGIANADASELQADVR